MAKPPASYSFCWNPLPIGKDELADTTPTESSGTPTPTTVVSRAPTPTPATALVVALSLDNKLCNQFIKAYLETQVLSRTEVDPEPCKQPLKARFRDLYYGNLHMNCY